NACKNLVFFVSLGLLDDPNHAIRQTCSSAPTGPPSLPSVQELWRMQGLPQGGLGAPPVKVTVHTVDAQGRDVQGFSVFYASETLDGHLGQTQQFVTKGSPSQMFIFPGTYVFWAAKNGAPE